MLTRALLIVTVYPNVSVQKDILAYSVSVALRVISEIPMVLVVVKEVSLVIYEK